MVETKKLETIYFDFHWPKYVDENLKHEKNKKKTKKTPEIKELLSKYKHGSRNRKMIGLQKPALNFRRKKFK